MNAFKRSRSAYTLVEVAVALAVFLVGIVGILQIFPQTLRSTEEAGLRGRAALMAQQKVEEIRLNADQPGSFIDEIKALDPDALPDPIPFARDDNLAYQFGPRSFYSDDPATGSEAWIAVRFNPELQPDSEIIMEMRFDDL